MKTPDGGYAFPTTKMTNIRGEVIQHAGPGMSLRDWFAGQVLAGIRNDPETDPLFREFAATAYQIADAMIEHRGNHP